MKKLLALLFIVAGLFLYASNLYAVDKDAALGKWYTSKEKDAAQITIYNCGDKYCGKISWTKDPESLDDENPDAEKKKRKLLGMDMVFDFNSLKADHIKFKNTNFAKCNDSKSFKVTNHHGCRMGKWIDSMQDEDILSSEHWEILKDAHKKVHMMTQDVVDLYSGGYDNGQVFSVTANVEKNMNIVFDTLDLLRDDKCTRLREKRDS